MEQTENAEAVAAEPQAEEQTATTVENAAPAPATDENSESSTEQVEKKPSASESKNVQKRFDQLTAEKRALREELDQLKRNQGRTLEYDANAPKPEDFATDEEFIRAEATYEATKNVISLINNQANQQAQAQAKFDQEQKIGIYNQKVQSVLEKTPDFQQVVGQSLLNSADANGNLTPAAQAIIESDNGPDIAYHVANNPELAMQLNNSDPVTAGRLVERLSAKLSVTPSQINEAPAPIGSENQQASGPIPGKDDFAEKHGRYEIKR